MEVAGMKIANTFIKNERKTKNALTTRKGFAKMETNAKMITLLEFYVKTTSWDFVLSVLTVRILLDILITSSLLRTII